MSNKVSPGYTTDLHRYAIRVYQGEVWYFDNDDFLKICSVEDGLKMQLHDLYKRNGSNSAYLKRNYVINGNHNKNAFRSAAAKMREGKTISDFCKIADDECKRQSTKPHKNLYAENTQKLILDVYPPKVSRKKKFIRVTVRFKINPKFEGCNSINEAMENIELFINEAKNQLYLVYEFEDIAFADLPNPCGLRIDYENVYIEFKV